MRNWKEAALDGLLALLVITSVALSLRVWYPPGESRAPVTTMPSVQPQPPASERQMPEIFRPEMILIRKKGDAIALVHTGSLPYKQLWPQVQSVISGLKLSGATFAVDQIPDRLLKAEWVQLRLPTPLMLTQWAGMWAWNTPYLRNGTQRVDRVTLYLGEPGAVYVSGPAGTPLYLSDLSDDHRTQLLDLVAKLDPSLFVAHRPLQPKDLAVRFQPDLLVPVIEQMPLAQVRMIPPNERDEEARYFPDLSVVRQIDERDARSLTDGQRLLRFTAAGLLEYRTADPSNPGAAPDMQRAVALAQEWVGSRGGWPQEVVLRRYSQQPGKAKLEFDFRAGGQYPVESVGAALQVHLSSQRVVYFSRYPFFVEMRFTREQQVVITPEEAVQRASDQVSTLLTEPIRSMHLAYVTLPSPQGGLSRWALEPSWVIQAGEARVYVPAAVGKKAAPVQPVR